MLGSIGTLVAWTWGLLGRKMDPVRRSGVGTRGGSSRFADTSMRFGVFEVKFAWCPRVVSFCDRDSTCLPNTHSYEVDVKCVGVGG